MARNLRAKIPEQDTLIICDANPETTAKFVVEGSGKKIEVADPRTVAEKSVRACPVLTCRS